MGERGVMMSEVRQREGRESDLVPAPSVWRLQDEYQDKINEQAAEIERLKELAESWKGAHSVAAADRDIAKAEIERLKLVVDVLEAAEKRYVALISDLSVWVKVYSDSRNVPNPQVIKVLQQAREVTKHE